MRRVTIAVAAIAVLTLGACGGDDSGNEVPTAAGASNGKTTTTQAGEQASEDEILDYFACLRKNGVDIEDPKFDADGNIDFSAGGRNQFGGGSIDRDAVEKAQKACGDFPNIGGGFGNRDNKEMQDQLLALAKCMRENGVDMPDPDFDAQPGEGGGGPFGGGNAIDRNDPKVQKAFSKCQDKLNLSLPGQPGANGDSST